MPFQRIPAEKNPGNSTKMFVPLSCTAGDIKDQSTLGLKNDPIGSSSVNFARLEPKK